MPFAVFVAFVGRDENRRARLFEVLERLEQMQRAHAVDVKSFARAARRIRAPAPAPRDEKQNPACGFATALASTVGVLNVANDMTQAFGQAELGEQGRRRRCGGRLTPVTSAPRPSSHSQSHAPLKPVCPVTSTRLPVKAEPKGVMTSRFSTGPCPPPTAG